MKCVKECPANALERYYTPEEEKILAQLKQQPSTKETISETADKEELEIKNC